MNLAWIAAVLRPQDVAPHPNFRDDEYDHQAPAALAAIVMGDVPRIRASVKDLNADEPWADSSLRYAQLTMHKTKSLREGLAGLRTEVLACTREDPAKACALALLACSAAAELEQYDVCDSILDALLSKISCDSSGNILGRAALLQQQSLRYWDSGRPHIEPCIKALDLLARFDIHSCDPFQLSPGVTGTYTDTLSHIVEALQQAMWSVLPRLGPGRPVGPNIASLQDQVRTPTANQLLWLTTQREYIYSKFLESTYKQLFRSRAQPLFALDAIDLFHPTLGLELLGHASVYPARKELALMRLAQATSSVDSTWADTLRLLRHAGASDELDLAIERLRTAGPLSALSDDARQILLQRNMPSLVRTVELQVVRAAAELMTPAELQRAIESVLAVIAAGGPVEFPGVWKQQVQRLGEAWITAAALANASGTDQIGLVADMLLEAANKAAPEGPLWETFISRTLQQLDWSRMPSGPRTAWASWLAESRPSMPIWTEFLARELDTEAALDSATISTLSDVAQRLNRAFRGLALPDEEVRAAAEVTRQALLQIQKSALLHTRDFGGISASDVAAALIVYSNSHELWGVLTQFLTDARVSRFDRNPALDRLAREQPTLPKDVADHFRRVGAALLVAPDPLGMPEDQLIPHPEFLRFLASLDLLDTDTALALVTELATSADVASREQAARTIAVLAMHHADPWLLALAMQLSHDAEAFVKAQAGRALALLAARGNSLELTTSQRLIELLREDGVLVPLMVLRELNPGSELPDPVMAEIRRLSGAHPSRFVRDQAFAVASAEHQ